MTVFVFIGSLLGSMAIGMPIAFALLVCSLALMLFMGLFESQVIAQNLINGADSFPLLAVPFFILAGEIMNVGGLAKRIVNVALTLVGHVRGGLGYVTIIAAVVLASLSGSAVADAAALATLLMPMMVAAGHNKATSAGLIASAGIIAPVIPPSIAFVIYGVASGASIKKLFLAGIVPGMLLGLALVVAWWWVSRKDQAEILHSRKSAAEVGRALYEGIWALMLPAIIVFGLRFGIFTPTEAAVVAAVYSFFVATVIYRELKWAQIYQVLVSAALTTSVVVFLVAAAMVSAWLITLSQISMQIGDMVEPFVGNQTILLIVIMLLVVVVGTALDMTPTILILTPILMPVIARAGIDPVYFGVLFIINNSIGLITPPVGTVLNVVCGVTRVSMADIIKGVTPFMLAQLFVLLLLILFPDLVIVPANWFAGH
jgi:tripartite ATP-independent transporter DctM subunit